MEADKTKWRKEVTVDEATQLGLSETEYRHLREILGRPLNLLELGICSALYSEHCSYKSTKIHLKNLPTSGERVLQGPGENAGIIDIGDGDAIAFKVESHNHPSFIEPFQGAATGVGGILRDIFTMGARPLALMNSLRFGAENNPRTKYLLSRAVAGIGSYGNCMGIPTLGGELFFHEAYNGNCLVNAFALGLVKSDAIFRGNASGIGNPVFYVGSKTGRDGIHGATMASESFEDDSEQKRPTVQVGDPFQEKLLLEACLEVMASGAVVGIQDMGAAGMTCATYEMAERAGSGLRIDLEKVPQREAQMNPYEIMLSESQERMLLVVSRGKEKQVQEIFARWDLDAVKIGEVVPGSKVDLFWHNELVSSMPAEVLTKSVPEYRWPEEKPADFAQRLEFSLKDIEECENLSSAWSEMLGSINLCSRWQVYSQYDSTVRSNTVIHPGGDAAVIRVKSNSAKEKGIAMTLDCNSRYCALDPRHGTALSLAEACRNIAAVGATPIGISDCLNFGNPQKPEAMWQIAESIRGLSDAARAFEIPIISGNVSLYNETKGKAILPTPLIALVGLIDDVSKCVTINFQKADDVIFVIGSTSEMDLGGSEYLAQCAKFEKGALPRLDYDREISTANLVRELIGKRLLKSCHDISSGGLAIALAECCFSKYAMIGAKLQVTDYQGRKDALLFAESGARYIISIAAEKAHEVEKIVENKNLEITLRGKVGGDRIEIVNYASLDLGLAYSAWKNGLSKFLGEYA